MRFCVRREEPRPECFPADCRPKLNFVAEFCFRRAYLCWMNSQSVCPCSSWTRPISVTILKIESEWRNNSFLGISSKAYQRRNSRNSHFPWRDSTWSGMKTSSTKWGKTCLSCGKSIIKKRLPLRQSNIEVTVSLRGVLGPVLYLIHTVDLSMNVHLLLLSLAMRYTFILRNTPR